MSGGVETFVGFWPAAGPVACLKSSPPGGRSCRLVGACVPRRFVQVDTCVETGLPQRAWVPRFVVCNAWVCVSETICVGGTWVEIVRRSKDL